MKQLIISIILIFCVYVPIIAQANHTKGMVEYNHIFVFDTINRLVDKETESFLYFDLDKQQSIFVWDRKSKNVTKSFIKNGDFAFIKVKNGATDPIGNIVFKDYRNSHIVCRDYVYVQDQGTKIISDQYIIDWKISDETKKIKEMVLQKAECNFRGRHYIAWFNPKIPIPDGPWKLRGLPGLILEAYDEKKHVQFNFTSLTFPAEFTQTIEAPTDGKQVVYNCVQFTAEYYNFIKEHRKMLGAAVQQAGGTVQGGNNGMSNIIERCY